MPSVSQDELKSNFNVALLATCLGCFPFLLLRIWAQPFSNTVLAARFVALCMPCLGWVLKLRSPC